MKRHDLIRHLQKNGCLLVREGGKHSRRVSILSTLKDVDRMNHSSFPSEYPLRLSRGKVVGMIGVSIIFIGAFATLAFTNKKAVSVFGLFTLSPRDATYMFWGFAGFGILGLLPMALATTWKGRIAGQKIAFADTGIWMPRSVWSSQHVLVPFSDIRGCHLKIRGKERLLEIELPNRKFWVGESWLPCAEAFDEFIDHLQTVLAGCDTNDTSQEAESSES